MSGTSKKTEVLIIRNWPKMVFMWPTALMSLICGLVATFAHSWDHVCGGAFLVCFTFNLLVITYDFPRSTSLTMLAVMVAAVLGIILLNQYYGFIPRVQQWLATLDFKASADFYYAIFAGMFLLFIGMALVTRFDYWELTSNELIHHSGMLGNSERFSTAGLKLNTEINDVFEYVLAGAGRMIMTIPGAPRPVVLDNVLRFNSIMERSKHLLSRRVVEIEREETPKPKDTTQQTQDEYE